MRRPRLRLVLAITIPLLLLIVLLAAWSIDSSGADGSVPRNVTLAGRDISKLSEDELAATTADVAEEYATTEVEVRTSTANYEVPAAELGLKLDQEATVAAALALDEDEPLVNRPLAWISSFLDERTAPLIFTVDEPQLDSGLAALGGNAAPVEPSVVATGDGFSIVSGSPGTTISSEGVADELLARAESGELPLRVEASAEQQEPTVSDDEARALAATLSTGTASSLQVTAGDQEATVPPATVRTWFGSEVTGDAIVATVDAETVVADLADLLPDETEAKDASFTVEGATVRIVPSTDGTRCCAPDTADRVLAAVQDGGGEVEVDLEVDEAEFTTEEAQALGVKEPVGSLTEWKGQPQVKSFTTYHDCCAPRVTNIHRMADLVRGTLVLPGEQFSINDVVGQRTAEKGFVEAGAIANGEHVEEIGGGVSQFATTMFNAAFFAGLPIDTYQMHSEHFDRYPYGREATMGFPNPDLAWTNDTPYGILVWTSYTDTSITVTLFSTQHATAAQTGQTTGRSGDCTTVSTERTITYNDGRTATDSFNGRYRDAGKTSC
jgi:vancomycin resistance protein YoaR